MDQRRGKGPLGGHEQEILERLKQGELGVDLAREFEVTEAAISKLKKKHDKGLSYTFQVGRGVDCKVVFCHRIPITQAHMRALIQALQREAKLLGDERDERKPIPGTRAGIRRRGFLTPNVIPAHQS